MMTDAQGRVWVRRNANGEIGAASSSKQPGEGWEPIAPDDPELLAFEETADKKVRELDKRFPGLAEKRAALSKFVMGKPKPDEPLN
jgi:hypothetical protein